MNLEDVQKIISEVRFVLFGERFTFFVLPKGDGFLIQVGAWLPDNDPNSSCEGESLQKGGKHYISSHACKEEVVNKCWYACQDFIIHEAREVFKYKGVAIYQPHWQVDKLLELCTKSDVARRKLK